jgi:nucleotide-binding universal stress UspA family protein
MIKRVLVPLDHPGAVDDVFPVVSALASAGANVRLIHVALMQDNVVTPRGLTVAYGDQEMTAVETLWADAVQPTLARLDGAAVDHVVRFGDPVREILAEAERFDADTIVVKTGTRSSVKRAVLGSVAETLLRRARVGVLLYRPLATCETSGQEPS